MTDTPFRIWVNYCSDESGVCHVEADLSNVNKFFDESTATAYVRADTYEKVLAHRNRLLKILAMQDAGYKTP